MGAACKDSVAGGDVEFCIPEDQFSLMTYHRFEQVIKLRVLQRILLLLYDGSDLTDRMEKINSYV